MDELTDEQKAMLDFERAWWKYAGAREDAIRKRFDCSTVVYAQRLNAVLDLPEAAAYDPLGVRRLRRLRSARRAARKPSRRQINLG